MFSESSYAAELRKRTIEEMSYLQALTDLVERSCKKHKVHLSAEAAR